MIVKKPTIVIYTCRADAPLLKEVCAGIEEEGVLYEVISMSDGRVSTLSAAASDASMLGVGIGIVDRQLSLHIKGMNVHSGESEKTALFSYTAPDAATARALGANGARVIKRLPLRLSE
jgi:hypothetical protein